MPIRSNSPFISLILAMALLSVCARAIAQPSATDETLETLIGRFWHAQTEEERSLATEALLAKNLEARSVFRALAAAKLHTSDVATGVVRASRTSDSGLELPYAVLVPTSYDPARRYPVEFMLHGGVGRPAWQDNEDFWRRGYDNLLSEDRITVVPAAWRDAIWWQEEQARNLPAILRQVKRDYSVDDNRVTMTGVSDGGTGAYFFAFKQPTPWAAFLPYIGNAAVLRNPQSGGGYRLYFENLRDKPLFIVNGENDPLYPASSIQPFIEVLDEAKVNFEFTVIEDGGHNLDWLPAQLDRIEAFKRENPRDPLPDVLQWVADRTDRYNRNHWLVIDERTGFGKPAVIAATRNGNSFVVDTSGVKKFTLLLSPSEIDFSAPVTVTLNGRESHGAIIEESTETLLKWAQRDLDRSMLFTAELAIRLEYAE